MPRTPVHAFAFPLFRITARILPFFKCCWLTRTGPALTWFVVKAPAASAGRIETSSAMSFSRPGLIPAWTPAARKPLGEVTFPSRSQEKVLLTNPAPPPPPTHAGY